VLGIFQQATAGIAVVLVGIVGLSLLVGGIVIMNIMLMVVSERTREIGLRKALGAKRRDIMSQVLTESITLSLVGGIIGIALGALFSTIISALTPVPSRSSCGRWRLACSSPPLSGCSSAGIRRAGGHARSDRSA
jgi:putative ABC transport system permease protein